MNVATFDKLAYVDALRAGGVPEDQARVHANALDSALREGVATNETLRSEVGALRTELQTEISALRAELKADIAEAKAQITRWMFTAMAGQTALIVALIKLL